MTDQQAVATNRRHAGTRAAGGRYEHPLDEQGRPMVLHVVMGALLEPDLRYRQSKKPTPLRYYRRPVAGFDGVDRQQYEYQRQQIVEEGGLETWAIYDFLLACAADRSWGRWYFLGGTHERPIASGIAAAAAMIRVDADLVALAVDVLTRPHIAALEWVPMPGYDELRASEVIPPDEDGPSGERGEPVDVPEVASAGRAAQESPALRGAGGSTPRADRAQTARRPRADRAQLNVNENGNGNSNDNRQPGLRPGTGRPLREPALTPTGTPALPAGPATAQPPPSAEHKPATSTALPPPAGPAADCQRDSDPTPPWRKPDWPGDRKPAGQGPGCQPHGDGAADAGPPTPAAVPAAGGAAAPTCGPPRGPAVLSVQEVLRIRSRDWTPDEFRRAVQCHEVGDDPPGTAFARLVYRALALPLAASVRWQHRELGAYREAFLSACTQVEAAHAAAGQADWLAASGWPDWFVLWLESRLRHARSIDVARYRDVAARARIWIGQLQKSLAKLLHNHCDQHGGAQ